MSHPDYEFIVLLVDDSPIDRLMASRLLKQDEDLRIIEADDGEQALDCIAENSPDLVITDMQMPRLGGLGLLHTISEKYPDLPVILVTSRGSENIAVQALESGAASYVPKARLAEDLLTTVQRALINRQSQFRINAVQESLVATESHYRFQNDPEHLMTAGTFLADTLAKAWRYPSREVVRIRMTLEEVLVNAMYHGNLELDPRVREMNLELYHELARSRISQLPYRDRDIEVKVRQTKDSFAWTITDGGKGFEPSPYLKADEASMLEQPYGRGILLMRTVMNDVKFNEQGNSVEITIHRDSVIAASHQPGPDEELLEAGFVFAQEDD